VAATALNERTTMATKDLAAFVNTPDWIVSLRNMLAHGTTHPSIQSLRLAGCFILHWLFKYYWKCWVPEVEDNHQQQQDIPQESTEEKRLSATILSFVDESLTKFKKRDEMTDEGRMINASLVAAKRLRVNAVRLIRRLKEEDSASLLRSIVKTMISCINHQSLSRLVEMCPRCPDVLKEVLENIWTPFLRELKDLKLLGDTMVELGRQHIHQETAEHDAKACAYWIKRIIEYFVEEGLYPSEHFLSILKLSLTHPRQSTDIYVPQITGLMRSRLGEDMTEKIELLGRIWFKEPEETEVLEAARAADIEDSSVICSSCRKRKSNDGGAELNRGPKYWRGTAFGEDVSNPEES